MNEFKKSIKNAKRIVVINYINPGHIEYVVGFNIYQWTGCMKDLAAKLRRHGYICHKYVRNEDHIVTTFKHKEKR